MQLDIKINLILHATEDEKKVLEGLENIFQIEQKDFQVEQVPGHFNNPILLISAKLKKRDAKKFLKHFCFYLVHRRLVLIRQYFCVSLS